MSSPDRKIEEALAKSGEEHQPPYAWQEQVWRQIEEPYVSPAAPKRRFSSWPIVSLAVVVLFAAGTVAVFQRQAATSKQSMQVAMDLKLKRKIDEFEQRIAIAQAEVFVAQQEVDMAFTRLEQAVDERSREEAKAAGRQARQMLKNKQARLEAIRMDGMIKSSKRKRKNARLQRPKARKEKKLIDKCAKSNDPLCGL